MLRFGRSPVPRGAPLQFPDEVIIDIAHMEIASHPLLPLLVAVLPSLSMLARLVAPSNHALVARSVFAAGWVRLSRHHGGRFDLDLRSVLNECADLDQRHRREVPAHHPAVGIAQFAQP